MKKFAIVKVNVLDKTNEWDGGYSYADEASNVLKKAELSVGSFYRAYEYTWKFRLFGAEKCKQIPKSGAPTQEQCEEFLRTIIGNQPFEVIKIIEL